MVKFSLVLLSIFTALNIFQSFYNNEPGHYALQYTAAENPSVPFNSIIIGTSHATHGIRPAVISDNQAQYYNFALNGGNSQFYLDWWDRVLLPNHPKIDRCIVSVDNFFVGTKNLRKLEQDAEHFSADLINQLFLDDTATAKGEILVNLLPALKYRTRILESLQLSQGDNDYLMKEYDNGFVPFETPRDEKLFRPLQKKDRGISEIQKGHFVKLLQRISQSVNDIVLVIPPEYGTDQNEYKSLREFLQFIQSQSGIVFLDFNGPLSQPEFQDASNYSDPMHLNGKGSLLFSEYLGTALDSCCRASE